LTAFIPPTLTVGEHVLRPFNAGNAVAWHAYLVDPRVTEHTSWPPITPELIRGVVEKIIAETMLSGFRQARGVPRHFYRYSCRPA
jgi:hypothetical protein